MEIDREGGGEGAGRQRWEGRVADTSAELGRRQRLVDSIVGLKLKPIGGLPQSFGGKKTLERERRREDDTEQHKVGGHGRQPCDSPVNFGSEWSNPVHFPCEIPFCCFNVANVA